MIYHIEKGRDEAISDSLSVGDGHSVRSTDSIGAWDSCDVDSKEDSTLLLSLITDGLGLLLKDCLNISVELPESLDISLGR